MSASSLDCVVIGYNELPFEQYERFLRNYGEESEAYRDLKFSFVTSATASSTIRVCSTTPSASRTRGAEGSGPPSSGRVTYRTWRPST